MRARPKSRPKKASLIRGRAAKLDQIINQPYLHRFFLQIWARGHECADVFRKMFNWDAAAYTL